MLFQSESAGLSWFSELTTAPVTFESHDLAVWLPLRNQSSFRSTSDKRQLSADTAVPHVCSRTFR